MYRTLPKSATLPYALYSAAQVQALDRLAIEQYDMPGEQLMETAGRAAFDVLCSRWPRAKSITVLVGTGNNGGDGFVVARLALQAGLQVEVLQLGDADKIGGDALLNQQRYLSLNGVYRDYDAVSPQADVIVDAMLGIGLQSELRGRWQDAVVAINALAKPVIAIDIPSGLHADTGAVMGNAIRADCTLTFIGMKQGLFTAAARAYCGEIFFDSLQVPARVYASQILQARRIDWSKLSHHLKPRPADAHKGLLGHLLLIGSDLGYAGAIRMAAEAALRCGTGLVSVATRAQNQALIMAGRPELMVHGVEQAASLQPLLAKASAVVFGPGAGQTEWSLALLETVLQTSLPAVIDADGLNLIATHSELHQQLGTQHVLTPHPGEAGRLLGISAAQVEADRFAAIDALRQKFACQVVLKGAGTLLRDAAGRQPVAVCSEGNAGMASGGMGDVLAGIAGAFLAQGYDAREAAELAVCLHAAAGDLAASEGQVGMLAADLMPFIRKLMNQNV